MKQIGKILKDRCRNNKGFTVIEVIAVLIILGIIAAVAISRGTGTDAAQLQAEVDTLKGHLRYAQYLAMNSNYGGNDTAILAMPSTPTIKWGIRIDGTSYTLIMYVNTTVTDHSLSLPGESATLTKPSTKMHSIAPFTASPAVVFSFDEWGTPYNSGTKIEETNKTIAISTQSITITPETGFIP